MLDLHYIRENLDLVRQNCRNRGVEVDLDALVRLDEARRALIAEQQAVQEQRNKLARDMKGRKPSDEERALGQGAEGARARRSRRSSSAPGSSSRPYTTRCRT